MGEDPLEDLDDFDDEPESSALAEVRRLLYRFGITPVQLLSGVVILVGLGVIGWAVLRPPAVPVESRIPMVTVPDAAAAPLVGDPGTSAVLAVHAAGAVVQPGLYELPAGSRVADLIDAAGGPAAGADLDLVNLAALLTDAQQVYVPVEGESVPSLATAAVGDMPAGPLDLNGATSEQLEALPGIGPSIAADIVGYRDRHGEFASVEELLDVPGIGDARLDRLRELVVVR